MKDFKINDARLAEFEKNKPDFFNNKTFRVIRADESVIEKENDAETFVAAIKEAGIERVIGLNLQFGGEPLISANISTKHKQTEIGNGLYVMLHSSGYMQNTLQKISRELNLNWFASELYSEITEDVMSDYERGMKILVVIVDKEVLTAIVTGQKKVFELELLPGNAHQLVEHDDENYIVEGDEQKGEAVVTKKYDAIRFYTDHNRNSETALVRIGKTTSMYMRDGSGNVMFEGDLNSGKDFWPYTMIEYHLGEVVEQNYLWIVRSRVPMEDYKK